MNGLVSPQVLYSYVIRALVMLIVIPFHEAAHALVSWKLGDSTAKDAGRLSLNPVRHFDLLGALCMVVGGVGWAKPVGINPGRFKDPKKGHGPLRRRRSCRQFSAGLCVDGDL